MADPERYEWWVPVNGLMLLICKECGCIVPPYNEERHTRWHEKEEA